MRAKNKYDLIITIVNKGYSDYIVDAARAAGTSGGTVMTARGTAQHEVDSFMGITIFPEKELILTLVKTEEKNKIMKVISDVSRAKEEGRGICFSLPVNDAVGVAHLLKPKKEKTTGTNKK